jgi:hypothetical protein
MLMFMFMFMFMSRYDNMKSQRYTAKGWRRESTSNIFREHAVHNHKAKNTAYRRIRKRLLCSYLDRTRRLFVASYVAPMRKPVDLTTEHAKTLMLLLRTRPEQQQLQPQQQQQEQEQEQQEQANSSLCISTSTALLTHTTPQLHPHLLQAEARVRARPKKKRHAAYHNPGPAGCHSCGGCGARIAFNSDDCSGCGRSIALERLAEIIAGTCVMAPQRESFMLYTALGRKGMLVLIKTARNRCHLKSLAEGIVKARRLYAPAPTAPPARPTPQHQHRRRLSNGACGDGGRGANDSDHTGH